MNPEQWGATKVIQGDRACRDKLRLGILAVLIITMLLTNAGAVYWAGSVSTNSSSWYIYRQSSNIDFNLSSSVEGKITPIEFHDRIIKPYHARYVEVMANDVRLRERTSALEGNYSSDENMNLWSNADNDINIEFNKPVGTDIYTFDYYEKWPASLTASRTLEYSGKEINDRDFEGNNRDFVGSNLLYNPALSEEKRTIMWIERMNATVLATNDNILQAEFMPTKYLGYLINTKTTGIADLRYRQSSPQYDVKRRDYPAISEGEEMYYGTYSLSRKIEMRSTFENNSAPSEDWLPCCTCDWNSVSFQDQYGYSGDGLFNCLCYPSDYSMYMG